MKRLWNRFQSLSRFRQIGLSVLAVHLALVALLCLGDASGKKPISRKPIAVRTTEIVRAPKAPFPTTQAANPTSQKIAAQEKAPPVQKKSPPPAKKIETAAAKSAPSKKGAAQSKKTPTPEPPETGEIDSALLHQISESLGAIASAPKTAQAASPSIALPGTVEIHAVIMKSQSAPEYGQTVSSILQNRLDLPEFGEVVAKIEIGADGMVSQCQILEAKSRKNAEFLKKRLQELAFPCFNEFGLSENKLDFTITFHNVENR